VTLIELLITIAIMAIGFLALISGFATAERQVGSTTDNAQLVTLARQVADVIETPCPLTLTSCESGAGTGPGQNGLKYVPCSALSGPWPMGSADYQNQLTALVTAGQLSVGNDSISITAVAQAQAAGSMHTVSGTTSLLVPINNCGGAGQSTVPDYGVQQITLRVSSPQGHSLVRTVYKRWN
jgi:type II secretory pathway pseudopilin PulG